MKNKLNLHNRFKDSIRKGRIEEKIGKMDLCFCSYDKARFISLEHEGETYVFLFDYNIRLNDLYTQIRRKVHKKDQEPCPGFENFTFYKAKIIIRFLQKSKLENYL